MMPDFEAHKGKSGSAKIPCLFVYANGERCKRHFEQVDYPQGAV
jgi:hypothetical protein